jgi:integrase
MPRRGKRRRIAKGISRDGSGCSVRVYVGGEHEERFPLNTPIETMTAWRDAEIKRRKDRIKAGLLPAGTFAADAALYLSIVKALPEYAQRVRDIGLWVEIFGDRIRSSIQPWEIREVRDRWLTIGPKMVIKKGVSRNAPLKDRYVAIEAPLAPNTVALRMRALENLWTVLDGRKADNPVREVPEPIDRDPEPRGLPYAVVERILSTMPPSKTRARLRVMAYTGLAQVEIKGIRRRGDLDLTAGTVWVRRRRKGRGGKMAPPAVQPLNAYGIRALREFVKLDAFGDFSTSSMWQRFQAAAARAGFEGLRPYDLRHSYGTAHFSASGNILATQKALRQASPVTTQRYAAAAIAPAMLEASQRLEQLLNAQCKRRRRRPSKQGAQNRQKRGRQPGTTRNHVRNQKKGVTF